MLGFRDREKTGIEPHRMNGVESSRFHADLDTAWRTGDDPIGDKDFLHGVATLEPVDSAVDVVSCLGKMDASNLRECLGNLGVVTGVLSKNGAIPGGVAGTWRSDRPVILLSDEIPAGYDRATEIARAVGILIYGYDRVEAVKEFANLVQPYLTEIDGQASLNELPHRQLGITAFREN